MLLNNDFLQVSILIDADDNDLIKTNTVDIQDETFTSLSSSKELSVSPPSIRSGDSRSRRCQADGESETPDTRVLEKSIENDTSAITTSAMNATLNSPDSNVGLPHVQLIGLYHKMWCIKMQIVKNPPIWPHTDEYRACRSPIISRASKIMIINPSILWFKNYENVRLSITTSFLNDIVWCAQYGLERDQIMFFFILQSP